MDGSNTFQKFETFLRNMGYQRKMPSSFRTIYNPSTALLWDQLINSVRPRDEIRHKRNNIIINRLSFNKENISDPNIELFKDELKYDIKEIEVWNKKQEVTRQYHKKLARIEEMRATVKNIEEQTNMKYLQFGNEQQKLFETQKFVHLLNRKAEEIEQEILDIETKLSLVRNLTPVEESKDNRDVLELLKKCSEKLENLVLDEGETQSKTVLDDSLGLLNNLTYNDSVTLDATFVQADVVAIEDHNCNDLLNRLLYNNNRNEIFNALLELKNLQKFQLNGLMHEDDHYKSLKAEYNNAEAITELCKTHLHSTLQIVQTENLVKSRKAKLHTLENSLWQQAANHEITEYQLSNFKAYVYRQRKEFGIEIVTKYLQNFINCVQSLQDEECNLQKVIEEAKSLNDDITEKRNSLEEKIEMFFSLHNLIPQMQNNTLLLIRKLNQFTSDLNWIIPLVKGLSVVEIDALVKFPLEYNAKIGSNDKMMFVRDLPLNHIPYEENQHYFTTFSKALQNPWNRTEDLLTNIFAAQLHMKFYTSLMTVSDNKSCKTYTLEELQKKDLAMFHAIEKLKVLSNQIDMNKTQSIITAVEDHAKMWLEMPFKQFVSKKRLFNSLPYEHYDKLYESFYMQL